MSDNFTTQDIIECSDDENYGFIQNQVIMQENINTFYKTK